MCNFSTHVEDVGMADTVKDAIYIMRILEVCYFPLLSRDMPCIYVYEDNQGAVHLVNNTAPILIQSTLIFATYFLGVGM